MQLPKITITGTAGSGKTTIAVIIAEALHNAGIASVIRNDDTVPDAILEAQPMRETVLKERFKNQQVVIDQEYGQFSDAPLIVAKEREFVEIDFEQTPRRAAYK